MFRHARCFVLKGKYASTVDATRMNHCARSHVPKVKCVSADNASKKCATSCVSKVMCARTANVSRTTSVRMSFVLLPTDALMANAFLLLSRISARISCALLHIGVLMASAFPSSLIEINKANCHRDWFLLVLVLIWTYKTLKFNKSSKSNY